jgi:hypothetical protein
MAGCVTGDSRTAFPLWLGKMSLVYQPIRSQPALEPRRCRRLFLPRGYVNLMQGKLIPLPESFLGIWEIRADRRDHSRAVSALESAKMLCRCQLFRVHPCVCEMNSIFDMHNRDCAAQWPIDATKVDRDLGLWANGWGGGVEVALAPGRSQMMRRLLESWSLYDSAAVWASTDPRSGCDGERGGEWHSRCKPASLAMVRCGLLPQWGAFMFQVHCAQRLDHRISSRSRSCLREDFRRWFAF